MAARLFARACGAALLLASSAGCVTVYHPLFGFQRPVAIDLNKKNFDGVRMRITCFTSRDLPNEAPPLCNHAKEILKRQGAQFVDEDGGDANAAASAPGASGSAPANASGLPTAADLNLEIRAELSVDRMNYWMYLLSAPSFTMFPMTDELGVRHHFSASDGNGEPLASEMAEARFTTYIGLGYLGANFLLNQALRKPQEEISNEASRRDFTRDFSARLSQLAFDARMRLEIGRGGSAK